MSAHDLATITADQFETWRDQDFHLDTGETVPLRLAEVRRAGQSQRPGGGFTLTFLAPAGPFLPQAIYPVKHPEFGRQEIFLVPVGSQDGENAYEAAFA